MRPNRRENAEKLKSRSRTHFSPAGKMGEIEEKMS